MKMLNWLVLAVLLGLGRGAVAHDCQPARFVELSPEVYYYASRWSSNFRVYRREWVALTGVRYLAVDEIHSMRTRVLEFSGREYSGVLYRTKQIALSHTRSDGQDIYERGAWITPYEALYWVPFSVLDDAVAAIRCQPEPESQTAEAMTAEQRDRAEARRFQILRALEELRPEDLL